MEVEDDLKRLTPGDPKLIASIVSHLKSQGLFDKLRRDCLADVDMKPAYLNVKQRVEGYASKFLSNQNWTPDLNKNQLRESLRRQINESGMLAMGLDHLVDQVVNPKIYHVFMPEVETGVKRFLGLEKPAEQQPIQQQYPSTNPAVSRASFLDTSSSQPQDCFHSTIVKQEQPRVDTSKMILPSPSTPISKPENSIDENSRSSLDTCKSSTVPIPPGIGRWVKEETTEKKMTFLESFDNHSETSSEAHSLVIELNYDKDVPGASEDSVSGDEKSAGIQPVSTDSRESLKVLPDSVLDSNKSKSLSCSEDSSSSEFREKQNKMDKKLLEKVEKIEQSQDVPEMGDKKEKFDQAKDSISKLEKGEKAELLREVIKMPEKDKKLDKGGKNDEAIEIGRPADKDKKFDKAEQSKEINKLTDKKIDKSEKSHKSQDKERKPDFHKKKSLEGKEKQDSKTDSKSKSSSKSSDSGKNKPASSLKSDSSDQKIKIKQESDEKSKSKDKPESDEQRSKTKIKHESDEQKMKSKVKLESNEPSSSKSQEKSKSSNKDFTKSEKSRQPDIKSEKPKVSDDSKRKSSKTQDKKQSEEKSKSKSEEKIKQASVTKSEDKKHHSKHSKEEDHSKPSSQEKHRSRSHESHHKGKERSSSKDSKASDKHYFSSVPISSTTLYKSLKTYEKDKKPDVSSKSDSTQDMDQQLDSQEKDKKSSEHQDKDKKSSDLKTHTSKPELKSSKDPKSSFHSKSSKISSSFSSSSKEKKSYDPLKEGKSNLEKAQLLIDAFGSSGEGKCEMWKPTLEVTSLDLETEEIKSESTVLAQSAEEKEVKSQTSDDQSTPIKSNEQVIELAAFTPLNESAKPSPSKRERSLEHAKKKARAEKHSLEKRSPQKRSPEKRSREQKLGDPFAAKDADISDGELSDVTVSSVHTSDLSSFDDRISLSSGDEDADEEKANKEKKMIPLKEVKRIASVAEDGNSSRSESVRSPLPPPPTQPESTSTTASPEKPPVPQMLITTETISVTEENKMGLRRQRKINPKYVSEEFSSIFTGQSRKPAGMIDFSELANYCKEKHKDSDLIEMSPKTQKKSFTEYRKSKDEEKKTSSMEDLLSSRSSSVMSTPRREDIADEAKQEERKPSIVERKPREEPKLSESEDSRSRPPSVAGSTVEETEAPKEKGKRRRSQQLPKGPPVQEQSKIDDLSKEGSVSSSIISSHRSRSQSFRESTESKSGKEKSHDRSHSTDISESSIELEAGERSGTRHGRKSSGSAKSLSPEGLGTVGRGRGDGPHSSKRYESSDLYKPRPVISSGSRRSRPGTQSPTNLFEPDLFTKVKTRRQSTQEAPSKQESGETTNNPPKRGRGRPPKRKAPSPEIVAKKRR